MATTTNYSFPTPDDTDLVKDGASAIRSFGTAVDTQIKDLSPGTTAGDIDYYTTSTAKARVGIGTAGQVLQVNAGATAPEWATPAGGGANFTLLNSGGTSLSGTSTSITGITGQDKLLILVKGASHGSAFDYNLEIQFNTNTGSVYTQQGFAVVGSSVSSIGATALSGINTTTTAILPCSTSANAASVASAFCLITGCNSAGVKAFTAGGGADSVSSATDNRVRSIGGIFDSSSTISSVEIKFGGGTFDAGTVFIYGSA